MTTVTVDIAEKDLANLWALENLNLRSFNEEGHRKIFNTYPITFYQKRMMGDHMVTVQIALDLFFLFKGHGLIK